MPGGASQARRALDAWQEWAKQRGAKGLAYVLFKEDGELAGPVAKNLTDTERAGLADAVGAKPGDCIFFAAGEKSPSRALLGAARVEIGHRTGLIDPSAWAFCWVVDAPMFEPAAAAVASGDVAVGAGKWTAVHHAFTSPKPEFMDSFDQDPESALSYAYDIVCNGNEIGGGSIRIHERDVQERVFELMGLDKADAQTKFGFLLEGFKFGAPPHGGIAFGWDRVVALLAGVESIRDVIAFPKSGGGYDPLTQAPAPITAQQRKEAGVDFKPEAKKPEEAQEGGAGRQVGSALEAEAPRDNRGASAVDLPDRSSVADGTGNRSPGLEALMDAAWPAPDRDESGGWVLRAADGVTQRANSVWPRAGGATPTSGLPCSGRPGLWYRSRRLPVIFQVFDDPGYAP